MATTGKALKVGAGILGGAALVAGISQVVLANYLVNYALVTDKNGKTVLFRNKDEEDASLTYGTKNEVDQAIIMAHREVLIQKRDAWLAQARASEVTIKSGGRHPYNLVGYVYPNPAPSKNWALLVHGYTGTHSDMEMAASFYAAQGYNVLIPDLRCHGKSAGRFVGMGWTDRLDLLKWVQFILDTYGKDSKVVLHGHSMGGAAVLMATGEALPSQVVAAVSDCAYTEVWGLFSEHLQRLFGLKPFPTLEEVNVFFKLRGGYDFKEASTLEQVRKSMTPTLFIHGADDDFVPTEMVYSLFEACAARAKKLLVVQGAGHAQSNQRNPELYFNTVFDFLGSKT